MTYEVEIKCQLASKDDADRLIRRMDELDPQFNKTAHKDLLNHYFNCDDLSGLKSVGAKYFKGARLGRLNHTIAASGTLSVRTRQNNGQTYLIVKGAPAGGDPVHDSQRLEFEEPVGVRIETLDQALMDAGLEVLAKWSAVKDSYRFHDTTVEIQFSPGYGYVAEVEKVVQSKAQSRAADKRVREVAKQLGLKEFDHVLIGRMYDYYNAHWAEYYGTQKTFSAKVLKSLQ